LFKESGENKKGIFQRGKKVIILEVVVVWVGWLVGCEPKMWAAADQGRAHVCVRETGGETTRMSKETQSHSSNEKKEGMYIRPYMRRQFVDLLAVSGRTGAS
jgi:hypothetical protein